MLKKIAAVISIVFAATLLTAMPTNANGGPSLSSVAPTNGTVSGGTAVTLTGSGFTNATGATIGGVAGTDFAIVDDSTITMTSPLRSSSARAIGRYPIVVSYSGGASSELVYFDYTPDFEVANITTGGSSVGRVVLGDLASRSQAKPIARNATTAPLTVNGTDSNTGEAYSYVFEKNPAPSRSGDFTGRGAYEVESDDSVSTNLTTGYIENVTFGSRSGALGLNSRGTCSQQPFIKGC